MKKPTLDILDSIDPEYNAYQSILPFTARFNEYTSGFSLNNQAWEEYFNELSKIKFNWGEIRYCDVVEKSVKIDSIVPDSVGVYLFVVRPINLINDLPKFVYYVGIAGAGGGSRSLSTRLKDYFSRSNLKKRDAIRILIYKHYKNIFINYSTFILPAGMKIEDVEKSLIGYFGTHLLANRDDIPVKLKPQSKAFNI